MKRILASLLAMCMLLGMCSGIVVAKDSESLLCWTADGIKRYMQSENPPEVKENNIELAAARNDYESGQIVVRSDAQELDVQSVEFSDLVNENGMISKENCSYHFALYELNIPTNDGGQHDFGTAGQPLYQKSEMCDPLSNAQSIHVEKGKNQPIYVKVYVPEQTVPGTYNGFATVKTSLGDVKVPISIEVFSAVIPELKDAKFTYFNWMTDIAQGYYTAWNAFTTYYDIQDVKADGSDFTPEFYEVLDNWGQIVTEHRQNMVMISTTALLDAANSKVDEAGNYTFDWTLFDKYVDAWLRYGITRFTGIHYGYHNKDVMLERDQDGNAVFVWKPYTDQTVGYDMNKDQWYRQYLSALAQHLEEFDITKYPQFAGTENQTLFDIWCQHLYDEPTNTRLWEYYAKVTDQYLVNSQGKQVKILDADMTGATQGKPYVDYLDIHVPQEGFVPGKENFYQNEMHSGKEFWTYVCIGPGKPWLNRFVNQPDTTYPLLFWYNAQVKANGYLHWGMNVWNVGPFADGDSYMVYPDKEGKTLMKSIRYEAQRDGVEDWELAQLARNTNDEMTQQLLNMSVTHPNGAYVKNIDEYRQMRYALLQLASGIIPEKLPEIDSGAMVAPEAPAGAYYVDNLDSRIVYTGMEVYQHSSETESYKKSVHFQNYKGEMGTEGGSAELAFTGTGIEFMSEKRSNKGDIKVQLYDAKNDLIEEKVVSCLANDVKPFYIAYSKTGLPYGDYKIKLTNIRTANGMDQTQFLVDAFIVHTMREDGTSDVCKIKTSKPMNGILKVLVNGKEIISGDSVDFGENVDIITIPNTGYYCKNLNINGVPVGIYGDHYTIKKIDKDVVIGASFHEIKGEYEPAENLAFQKPVTASGLDTANGYTKEGAVDGVKNGDADKKHKWSSNQNAYTEDSWLTVDLGNVYMINKVALSWPSEAMAQFAPAKYMIQVSETGEEDSFQTVFRQNEKISGEDNVHIFEPVKAKYVRLYVPKDPNATWNAYEFNELEVYEYRTSINDKSHLQAEIEKAKELVESQYTEESWAKMQAVLDEAILCELDFYASVEEIQQAADRLAEAISQLEVVPETYHISLQVNEEKMGKVSIEPDQETYTEGTKVVVSAVPSSEEYEFVRWLEVSEVDGKETVVPIQGATAKYEFVVQKDCILRAEFREVENHTDNPPNQGGTDENTDSGNSGNGNTNPGNSEGGNSENGKPNESQEHAVQTGDQINVGLWITLLGCFMTIGVSILGIRRKNILK